VNSTDVRRAVALAQDTLAPAAHLDWHAPAAGLEWTCWETVEHMADDLFTYAAQLGPAKPSVDTYVKFGYRPRRPGGPHVTVYVDPAEGPDALLEVLEVCGAMLAALIDTVPADRLSFHNYGPSDPSGFAAMGVVEVLVHLHDVAGALGLAFAPPADLCSEALRRLFPEAPDGEPWPVLLWCTGRADLPGRPAPATWKWDGSPQDMLT
jgi:hypothetical protein